MIGIVRSNYVIPGDPDSPLVEKVQGRLMSLK